MSIDIRREQARQYAAEAKARNTPPCSCPTCKQLELLPMVQRLTQNYQPVRQQ